MVVVYPVSPIPRLAFFRLLRQVCVYLSTTIAYCCVIDEKLFLNDPNFDQRADMYYVLVPYYSRVPTSSGNPGKPGKSLKKNSMHGKIMEFDLKKPE